MTFEWDSRKAALNLRRHEISFDEASTAFGDLRSRTIRDPYHSIGEERFILLGRSFRGRIVVVVHTERADRIRLISARKATRAERRRYEEN
jgi:uncharacterized DUF497 family protein